MLGRNRKRQIKHAKGPLSKICSLLKKDQKENLSKKKTEEIILCWKEVYPKIARFAFAKTVLKLFFDSDEKKVGLVL